MLQGYHLLAEGAGVSQRWGAIGDFLRMAVEATGLTVIMGPAVDEGRGIGFVVIAESHISVHLKGDRAFVDVFSCQPFGEEGVIASAIATFGGKWSHQTLRRDAVPAPALRGSGW